MNRSKCSDRVRKIVNQHRAAGYTITYVEKFIPEWEKTVAKLINSGVNLDIPLVGRDRPEKD